MIHVCLKSEKERKGVILFQYLHNKIFDEGDKLGFLRNTRS